MFLTGATGFIGKVVLEKLLRSLSGVKKIYLLIRQKKGVPNEERLKIIFSSELFSRVFEEQPQLRHSWRSKVAAINGDLT